VNALNLASVGSAMKHELRHKREQGGADVNVHRGLVRGTAAGGLHAQARRDRTDQECTRLICPGNPDQGLPGIIIRDVASCCYSTDP